MNTYPVILCPLSIEKALASLPPVPEPPKVSPPPILQLLLKPEEPEVFIESPPVRIKLIPYRAQPNGISTQ